MNPAIIALVEEKCALRILSTEKIFSRRNEVWRAEGRDLDQCRVCCVIKVCTGCDGRQEASILKRLSEWGIAVPAVKWSNHDLIVMEYIDGRILADLMDRADDVRSGEWIEPLARWLYHLHKVGKNGEKVCCVPDLNLRNFIFDGRSIVGLDFDEWIWDVPERDLGGISAFILNSRPMFTPDKFQAIIRLIEGYEALGKINRALVREYLWREMQAAAERRADQREYLLSKIEELKNIDVFKAEMAANQRQGIV